MPDPEITDDQIREFFNALSPSEDPDRKAYSILRQIYLPIAESFWELSLNMPKEDAATTEWQLQLKRINEEIEKLSSWFEQSPTALSLAESICLSEFVDSTAWKMAVLSKAGKRPLSGRPASKRWLALWALDLKCEKPELSYSEVTAHLCQCGREKHPASCREQLRQQINILVEFFRGHGFDFGWDHIRAKGGCK